MTGNGVKRIFSRQTAAVVCPGCGEEIKETDDFSKIGYVKTKRGTHIFLHKNCLDKVWRERK